MKKKISLIGAVLLLSVTLIVGCGGQKLASAFDETEVEKAAQNVVEMVNDHDTDAMLAICAAELKTALTDDVLSQIYAVPDAAGAYEEVEGVTVVGSQDKNTKKDYATAVIKVKYKNNSITYTITFDTDMNLAGLYLK